MHFNRMCCFAQHCHEAVLQRIEACGASNPQMRSNFFKTPWGMQPLETGAIDFNRHSFHVTADVWRQRDANR